MVGVVSATADALPALRSDLLIVPSPDRDGGALVHDPLARRWHRLDRDTLALVRRWVPTRAGLAHATGAGRERIDQAVAFLERSGLLVSHRTNVPPSPRKGWLARALHGYLFVRVPLGNPTRLLDATLPLARWLASPAFRALLIAVVFTAVLLVAKRGSEAAAQFVAVWSIDNATVTALALGVAKLCHEAGHAYAARLRGAAVPSWGVAFMVLYPVLYTDTTDAWRLPRRSRLRIDLAGIHAELVIGAAAALAWALLPDGDLRSAAFILAAVAWIGSLAVNLNPFMRFDGYHVLADALGMPNLQQRAFALARWRMREALFGFGIDPPERLPTAKRRLVIAYAFGTWAYRLALFVGIALLVYHMAFKALGIVLFVVEIGWFVLRPLRDEVREWWKLREGIALARGRVLLLCGGVLLCVLVVPWSTTVRAPAVLTYEVHAVRAPVDGFLAPAHGGGAVARSEALATLRHPDLTDRFRIADAGVASALAAERHALSVSEARAMLPLRERASQSARSERDAVVRDLLRSSVRAPRDGVFEPDRSGWSERWVAKGDDLGTLVSGTAIVRAHVSARELDRVGAFAQATFVPDRLSVPRVRLERPRMVERGKRLADAVLLRSNGGPMRGSWIDGHGTLETAIQSYRFTAVNPPELLGPVRGTVHIPARRRSLASRFGRYALSVAIRESGL